MATDFILIKSQHLIPELGLLSGSNWREERIAKVSLSHLVSPVIPWYCGIAL